MSYLPVAVLLCTLMAIGIECGRLTIHGHHFAKDGKRVFLNGVNMAWVAYGYDFGNNQYQYRRQQYEKILTELSAAGGNSIRVWLHIEGSTSPHFTSSGMVDATDETNTLISDMQEYVRTAARNNILVFFCLWNGAKKQAAHNRLDGLIKDTHKLQSYIDNALIPMVNALKDEPGLGGWDIMNEPEGEMIPGQTGASACEDTTSFVNSGMGWESKLYTAKEIQRFVNWQTDAIRKTDPGALISVGVWNPKANTDSFGFNNLYKDECLVAAGGKTGGTLNFYQIHSYSWGGKWDTAAAFVNSYANYHADGKPIVVGEFRSQDGAGMSSTQMYNYVYTHGYAGAWGWAAIGENWNTLRQGITALRHMNDQQNGGLVQFIG